jgi:hypothetical protein
MAVTAGLGWLVAGAAGAAGVVVVTILGAVFAAAGAPNFCTRSLLGTLAARDSRDSTLAVRISLGRAAGAVATGGGVLGMGAEAFMGMAGVAWTGAGAGFG